MTKEYGIHGVITQEEWDEIYPKYKTFGNDLDVGILTCVNNKDLMVRKVLSRKEEFINPFLLESVAKVIKLSEEDFEAYEEFYDFIYGFMEDNPEWQYFHMKPDRLVTLIEFEESYGLYKKKKMIKEKE